MGNRVMADGPRTDVDDRSYVTYDALRRPVFEIEADPDGGGPRIRRIVKHHFDVDGREYLTETGFGNSIMFSNGVPTGVSDFVVSNFVRHSFDAVTGDLVKTETGAP
jgi:hypothetical protein